MELNDLDSSLVLRKLIGEIVHTQGMELILGQSRADYQSLR